MPPLSTEEDIAWLKSTFHPIPKVSLPDDTIEYAIYLLSGTADDSNDSETRLKLRDVQKYVAELQKQWLKGYIWQRQAFSLELRKDDGVSYLRGCVEYGDSIEDEWVIVWLLREITRKFSDAWVKVTDNDGEFLLIEASGTLPSWLEPDVAENRVWINDGQLKIIRPEGKGRSVNKTGEKLSMADARRIILTDRKRLMHSISIEEEAFFRLRNYPGQIRHNMHHALVTIPRKIAFLLQQKTAYISPAIEAFYLRDPISMKALNSSKHLDKMVFPPKDFVTVSAKFPKVAYAQMKSQEFPVPRVFEQSSSSLSDVDANSSYMSGLKLVCGFEMLLTDKQYQDLPAVREMKMLLEDLDSENEKLPTDAEIATWERVQDDEKWLDIDFNDLQKELNGRTGSSSGVKSQDFADKTAQENLRKIVKQFEDFLNDDQAGPDEDNDDLETLMQTMEKELKEKGAYNDIDANLVQNLLESFKAQGGAAGPMGNLMGLMGVNMPRDGGDSSDDDNTPGPSKR
ncbi:hypothetical protein DV738_g4489, partial [Chaetothyriales sp. CBS 135597]